MAASVESTTAKVRQSSGIIWKKGLTSGMAPIATLFLLLSIQCIAAKKAGAEVDFISKIGNDPFGRLAIDYLAENHIFTDRLIISETEPSGTALIIVDDRTSQNLIAVFPGACDTISADEVTGNSAWHRWNAQCCGADDCKIRFEGFRYPH